MSHMTTARDGAALSRWMRLEELLCADGIAHTRPINVDPVVKSKGRHFDDYTPEQAERIKKCLNCKKPKCTGGAGCFRGGGRE